MCYQNTSHVWGGLELGRSVTFAMSPNCTESIPHCGGPLSSDVLTLILAHCCLPASLGKRGQMLALKGLNQCLRPMLAREGHTERPREPLTAAPSHPVSTPQAVCPLAVSLPVYLCLLSVSGILRPPSVVHQRTPVQSHHRKLSF